MTDPIRLSKLMSERGICSRREADRYIEQGQVQVDGLVISTLGTKVRPDAKITLLPDAQSAQNKKITILLNKPLGFLSVHAEQGYPAARELLTPDRYHGDPQVRATEIDGVDALGVAGRLDINSKGLLVFSDDGVVIKQIIGPESGMEKEYLVRIAGTITTEILPATAFYFAEDYHQQYLAKNPGGYCGLGGTGVTCPIGTGVTG